MGYQKESSWHSTSFELRSYSGKKARRKAWLCPGSCDLSVSATLTLSGHAFAVGCRLGFIQAEQVSDRVGVEGHKERARCIFGNFHKPRAEILKELYHARPTMDFPQHSRPLSRFFYRVDPRHTIGQHRFLMDLQSYVAAWPQAFTHR